MKDLFRLFFVIFSLFFLVSCGGNEGDSSDENEQNSGSDNVSVSLRVARDVDSSCAGMDFECLTQYIGAIAFKITDGKGNIVFSKSVQRNELKNLDKELTGIKNAENATLVVSVFLGEDMNTVKWQGKTTGLKFEKGKATKATILLYPVAPREKEIPMPEQLATARFGHSATVLVDGRILVAGGFPSCGANGKCIATESVEIIDMESGRIETLVNMKERRAMHAAVALNDGSVLFIGGVQGFSAAQQETAFTDFPLLPYTQNSAVTTIERYMPYYPKFNMRENNPVMPIENSTETITVTLPGDTGSPFMAFQSILAKRISKNQTDVFLVGGVDENNVPSKKSYKLTVTETEDGTAPSITVSELAESSSPLLLPALAYSGGSVLAVGGRPVAAEEKTTEEENEGTEETETTAKTGVIASIISANESRDIEGDLNSNIFFTNSIAQDNVLYTLGGMPNKSGVLINSNQNVLRKWNPGDGSFQTPQNNNGLLTDGKSVVFAETLYNPDKNQISLIGGTDAENLYQIINASNLEVYDPPVSHRMTDRRIMPKASLIPAGIIGDRQILVITGGTSALDSSGSASNTIKINIL